MDFYIPTDQGEFLAFSAALATALFGLGMMLFPGTTLRLLGLDLRGETRRGLAEARSLVGGTHAGFALAAVFLAQPMVYLALGAALALGVFSRILSMMSDRSAGLATGAILLVQTVLAALPLAYVFGLI
ncbi:AGROH133_08824 family phage infection protein [Ensifer soli]|uniref:AGROH133_08824 family phage infection protein n=1 Tax=Ciceribacter sp. sgz301302 TaxID=3342379 RepID=UPI0035B83E90